jgi:hypothetical protein
MSDETIQPNPEDNDTQELSTGQLDGAVGGAGTSSVSESSELDYLQLQTTQSADTKAEQAVSNLEKKISDTANAIIGNFKS